MTYTQLKANVVAYSHRTDLDSMMDVFVGFAESNIDKDLRAMEMEKSIAVSYADEINPLPDDFLRMRSFTSTDVDGNPSVISFVSPEQLNSSASSIREAAIVDNSIKLSKAPDVSTPLEGTMSYYARVPSLTSNATNDVLDNFQQVYMCAMMIEVNVYLQDDAQINIWKPRYDEQIQAANRTSDEARLHLAAIRPV